MYKRQDAYSAIADIASGDARYAINLLQAAAATDEHITRDDVYQAASRARPEEVREMIDLALAGKFVEARNKLLDLLVNRGMSGDLIIKEMHNQIVRNERIPDVKKPELINLIGEYEFRILEGGSEIIQLDALLARLATVMR